MALQLQTRRGGLQDRFSKLHVGLLVMLSLLAGAGVVTLYSAAEGSWTPWALSHGVRYLAALGVLAVFAFIGMRAWMFLAYPIYAIALFALLLVPFVGETVMGAQRWIDVGHFQFQPSELMKLGLVMALARYYHGLRAEQVSHIFYLIPPLVMIGAPVGLVFSQPDLGTSMMLGMTGVAVMFLAGLSWRIGFLGMLAGVGAVYAAYRFELLKQYQIDRILTFLDPDRDPLGQGYHLFQSKTALGSAGFAGKGYLEGSQAQLKFLPEMQTDFIFTMFGEEFGLIGCIALLAVYLGIVLTGVGIALRARTHFARLTAMGVVVTFALYVMINAGMVMGLAPVVGVPLPLVSYGGTVMFTIMAGFGLVMSAHMSRDQESIGLA